MENLLDGTPRFLNPDNAWASVYRADLFPDPQNEWEKGIQRFEGYFFILSNKRDPGRLLVGASEHEVSLMVLDNIGGIGEVLGSGSTRTRFEVKGYSWRLGNIVGVDGKP